MKKKLHKKSDEILVWRAVKELYADLDRAMAKRLLAFPDVTCKKGCYGCCHLFTTIGPCEAVSIAHHIMQRPDWKEWLPRIRRHALGYCFTHVGHISYFVKAIPCVFLSAEHLCEIYPMRPAECRYHYVVTPPEHCYPNEKHKTAAVDTRDLKEYVIQFEIAAMSEQWTAGPLTVMIAWGFKRLLSNGPANDLICDTFADVPSPSEWLMRYGQSTFDQQELNPPEIISHEV